MEHNNAEVAIIERALLEFAEMQHRELNELRLALVGGGVGERTSHDGRGQKLGQNDGLG